MPEDTMRIIEVYHRTANAEIILTQGFLDATRTHRTGEIQTGVWFSDEPCSIQERPKGQCVLSIQIPEEVFAQYEWFEKGQLYRKSLIPAAIANHYGPAKVHDHDFQDFTRQELLETAERFENAGLPRPEISKAIEFFDTFCYLRSEQID
jgi:hypothetical protein